MSMSPHLPDEPPRRKVDVEAFLDDQMEFEDLILHRPMPYNCTPRRVGLTVVDVTLAMLTFGEVTALSLITFKRRAQGPPFLRPSEWC